MPTAASVASAPDLAAERCAVHPGRPAADRCPVCARPRCAADTVLGRACAVCGGQDLGARPSRPPLDLGAVCGAAAAAHLTAVASGFVGQEYVEVRYFSLLVPAGVGILCAIAAEHGARGARGLVVRVVAAAYAVLSAGLAFHLEGSVGLLTPVGTVLPPYVAAAAGAWLWTQPPSQRRRRAAPDSAADAVTRE